MNSLALNNSVTAKLLNWYHLNQRNLPWRHSRDPYRIWLSEIILQQTRVQQGLPYYQKFVDNFSSVEELAAAPEQEVLRLWQGLGYYSRARNLHSCAKTVVKEHGGQFPGSYKELLKLKGIGPYTAAAIASFAFKEVVPVVDGNVYRVLSRFFGISTDISQPSAYKEFLSVAQELISPTAPDLFNQAIMEFGAMHCTPHKPLCEDCPLQGGCFAFERHLQKELPVKKSRIKMKHRYFHYFIFSSADEKIMMRRREKKDIWQGLYDFHLVESANFESPEKINDLLLQQLMTQNSILVNESGEYQHQLTHQKLHVKFFYIKTDDDIAQQIQNKAPELKAFSLQEVQQLPKPILIKNYLEKLNF